MNWQDLKWRWKALVSGPQALIATKSDTRSRRWFPVPRRHAGVHVDEDTALTCSAYFCGVRLISSAVAGMPWETIRETPTRTEKMTRHRLWDVLQKRPNPEMSAYHWRQTMIVWAITWGNGYAEIERSRGGDVLALWPISPDRVTVTRDESNEIVYEVRNYRGDDVLIPSRDMFHLHGMGFDGLQGYSVVSLAAKSIGLSLGAESFSEDFFANGAVAVGGIKVPGELSQESYDRFKEDWAKARAEMGNKWKTPLFEGGSEWVPMSMPADDAQMLETRQFQVSDIARWLGVPPHKLMDLSRATFSNIESQNREITNDAYLPWIHPLEQEANFKLLSARDRGLRTKINVRGLLRGDDASRAAYYQVMRNMGIYSTNNILALEDMDLISEEDGGDLRVIQGANINLKSLVGDTGGQSAEQNPTLPQVQQSYLTLFADAFDRILRREEHRFEQTKHKDAQSFADWMEQFGIDQSRYMDQTLRPLVSSLVGLCDPSAILLSVLPVLDAAIDSHMEVSQRAFEDMKSGRISGFDPERAQNEAKDLIERIFARISEQQYAA